MRGPEERPEGLRYAPDFLDPTEERDLVTFVETLQFDEVRMHGQVARRTVRHFGYDYAFESWDLVPGDPLPAELSDVRRRGANFAGLAAEQLAQALVTRYPPGATIGWHRDAPIFGATVVGVSLLSACVMRFQRGARERRRVFEQPLPPRSVYVLAGPARSSWQHSIPAVADLRYSITFRTLRGVPPPS
jgi:alkylated DNA repair dioxygenase AlkB